MIQTGGEQGKIDGMTIQLNRGIRESELNQTHWITKSITTATFRYFNFPSNRRSLRLN